MCDPSTVGQGEQLLSTDAHDLRTMSLAELLYRILMEDGNGSRSDCSVNESGEVPISTGEMLTAMRRIE
jgi:hypothetical protein